MDGRNDRDWEEIDRVYGRGELVYFFEEMCEEFIIVYFVRGFELGE